MTEQNKETQKRESFYAKLQEKMFDLIQSSAVYLKHAPKDEKLGLCLDIKKQQYEVYRLIRKRSLCNFNRALKKRNVTSLVSILGHAVHTSTCKYMLTRMAEELTPEPIGKLPDVIRWKLAEIQYPEMV